MELANGPKNTKEELLFGGGFQKGKKEALLGKNLQLKESRTSADIADSRDTIHNNQKSEYYSDSESEYDTDSDDSNSEYETDSDDESDTEYRGPNSDDEDDGEYYDYEGGSPIEALNNDELEHKDKE